MKDANNVIIGVICVVGLSIFGITGRAEALHALWALLLWESR